MPSEALFFTKKAIIKASEAIFSFWYNLGANN